MKIIDIDKRYMYPDKEHMKLWFTEFNARFFDNKLPAIELRVGWVGKHTLGSFHDPTAELPTGFYPDKCCITLNNWFFDTEDEWRNTMVHEMVHYYVYMKYGKTVQGHGKEFKAETKRINAMSEFEIDTYAKTRTFCPKPSITDKWGSHFDDEIILGSYFETYIDDFEDEDTHEVIKIELSDFNHAFSFRTKRRYIPEIIDNMRNVRGKIEWYQVDECCQKLFLLPVTTSAPSFKKEEIYHAVVDEESLLDDFGPIKWTHLGTTEFIEDSVQGYSPGQRKDDIRQKYFRDAEEIGRLAADRLVRQYQEHPRWFTSIIHGTHDIKPSCQEYTIQVDSRFKTLLAMTPKRIMINPSWSELMMERVKNGDTGLLASEITRVILSRKP